MTSTSTRELCEFAAEWYNFDYGIVTIVEVVALFSTKAPNSNVITNSRTTWLSEILAYALHLYQHLMISETLNRTTMPRKKKTNNGDKTLSCRLAYLTRRLADLCLSRLIYSNFYGFSLIHTPLETLASNMILAVSHRRKERGINPASALAHIVHTDISEPYSCVSFVIKIHATIDTDYFTAFITLQIFAHLLRLECLL